MKLSRNEIYSEITRKLKEELAQGKLPWRRSWKIGIPSNIKSKRNYNGINFLNLSLNEYPSPYYLTYLQCKELGGYVNRGEKGSWIIYWDIKELPETQKQSELRSVPFIRRSIVFNLAQTSLFEGDQGVIPQIVDCKHILESMINKPDIKHNTMRAFYSPSEDYISLPPLNSFDSEEEYWSTLWHELVHSTAHKSRLNREINMDEDSYSYEELVAEIGSAYLCGLTGIAPQTIKNQAAYIRGWMKLSESDQFLFMKAALDAQKATNHILSKEK